MNTLVPTSVFTMCRPHLSLKALGNVDLLLGLKTEAFRAIQ
jgi:hypothetical protein